MGKKYFDCRRWLRFRLRRYGVRRPVALIRARQLIAGRLGRGSALDLILDLNLDLQEDHLVDALESYGPYLTRPGEQS